MEEVEQLEQVEQARNTKKHRAYSFTWNNYPPNYEEIINGTGGTSVYQLEEAPETGKLHVQGCIKFKNPRSFKALQDTFVGAHIEICKNWIASVNYCSKEATRAQIGPLVGKELYPWQAEIMDIIEEIPNDRSIHWYWEEDGCVGKTTLAKHICLNRKDAIYLTGKAADMKYGIMSMKVKPKVVILDFSRSQEEYISYQGIEEIKNGIFFNTKYESGMCIFDCPHVICFSNFPPQIEKLSLDRWLISRIGEQKIEVLPLPKIDEFVEQLDNII